MMYTRAAASDYDDWENIYENPGWGSKDLIPLLKKVFLSMMFLTLSLIHEFQTETFQVRAGAPTHGDSGPLKVSNGGLFTNIGGQFLEVAAAYDKERRFTEDVNGLFSGSCNAYGVSIVLIGIDPLFISILVEMAKVLSFLLPFILYTISEIA
jgi:alcohol oxidase